MFHIDSTVHLSDIIIAISGIAAFMKVFISNRDIQRGLIASVAALVKQVDRIDMRQEAHHEWLIRDGLDMRTGPDRRIEVERRAQSQL